MAEEPCTRVLGRAASGPGLMLDVRRRLGDHYLLTVRGRRDLTLALF